MHAAAHLLRHTDVKGRGGEDKLIHQARQPNHSTLEHIMRQRPLLAVLMLTLQLGACATHTTRTVYVAAEDPATSYRASHGHIVKIERDETDHATTGGGAVLGAVVGGVAGHQLGQGRGNDVATVAGAVGGALVGNEIEQENSAPKVVFRVTVRLDNGLTHTYRQGSIGRLQLGDYVRIDHNHVVRS